jgi:hypothetical protein
MTSAVKWLRISYRLGAAFDAAMLIPMLSPTVGGRLFGIDNFAPGPDFRYAMGVAAALMAGWTALLLWADRRPLERRGILLLTVCPVLVGLMAAGAYAVAAGLVAPAKMLPVWILQFALATLFVVGYRRGAAGAERDSG